MVLEVYEDVYLSGGPVNGASAANREEFSWLEADDDDRLCARPPCSSGARLTPVLAAHPHLAITPTGPLKTWVRHVQAFCESETMLQLQEETLSYKDSKALAALNGARVMVHNVFGFTGRRAEQARITMYFYQMTLVYVGSSARRRRIQDVMEDMGFHLALVTVCCEVCAFVYREEDGRFSPGFPVLTNSVQQADRLPEALVCLDWFCQCFRSQKASLSLPHSLQDYVDAMFDAVIDRGLFGDADMLFGTTTNSVPLLAPGRPASLVSYCIRHVLLYLHAKIEHVICQAWQDTRGHGRDHLIEKARLLMDVLIRERMDVLFGSTCSLVVMCCVYCSGKVWGEHLGFGDVCQAAGVTWSRWSVHKFYNEEFLPIVYGFELDMLHGVMMNQYLSYKVVADRSSQLGVRETRPAPAIYL